MREPVLYDFVLSSVETRFDCVKLLKRSARGEVLLLRHKESGQNLVFRRFMGSAQVYRRLLEVKCANLPQVYEVAERDGQVLVLEEYVRGDSLSFLLEGGKIPKRQVRAVGRQLCNALQVLHSVEAVHRDIKPDNVILRADEAVLIDFDASRLFDPDAQQDTQVLGTIGYAAPEQYGISQSDSRSDIYSMGVLLNVMLTGKHPSMELASGRMERVIRRCTEMNPQRRYQTVKQLMDAL